MRGTKVIDGKRCSFTHPKRCTKYCRYGSKGKNGCKKGVECDFDLPHLCRNSFHKRVCTNQKCTYVHLAGTARKKVMSKKKNTKSSHRQSNSKQKESRNQNSTRDGALSKQSQSDSFLELKSMMQTIQESFQSEILLLKTSLAQQRIPLYTAPPPWPSQMQYPFLSQPTPQVPPVSRVTLPSSC